MNPYTFIRAKLLETRNWLKVRHCLSLYRNLYIESQFYLTLYSYDFTRFPLLSRSLSIFYGVTIVPSAQKTARVPYSVGRGPVPFPEQR